VSTRASHVFTMFPVLANGQCVVVRVAVMKNQSWTWVGSIVELIWSDIQGGPQTLANFLYAL